MKISSIELKKTENGLNVFTQIPLGKVVVIAGSNGSGKTRLLRLLEQHVESLKKGKDNGVLSLKISYDSQDNVPLTIENAKQLQLVNYSHFDAQLQLPEGFTPYVICQAKELLSECDYEETALNSLLLLEDMAKGYSDEFRDGHAFDDFTVNYAKPFQLVIQRDENHGLKLFDRTARETEGQLSPGQRYLLRIAVACYQNQKNDHMIFLLDEPELHLHPKAQIELMRALRTKFPDTQFWICTHSLTLISYLIVAEKDHTVLYMKNGQAGLFRSNSSDILDGLIGAEENRFAVRQLLSMPDEYACNKFAVECTSEPAVNGAVSGEDAQVAMVAPIFQSGDIIVDYGVGKGRLLGELSLGPYRNIIQEIHYYAYDAYNKDAEYCRAVMESCGVSPENYYNEIDSLLEQVQGQVDYVLLINVLHEIAPDYWTNIFAIISKLLKQNGHLIIVEREELTIGEAPYDNGFLVLTEASARKLFSQNQFLLQRHERKSHIVKYTIPRSSISVAPENVRSCIEQIRLDEIRSIETIKGMSAESDLERYRIGIKLAFHLHQYANASLILEGGKIK